jgi:hypothetical protein
MVACCGMKRGSEKWKIRPQLGTARGAVDGGVMCGVGLVSIPNFRFGNRGGVNPVAAGKGGWRRPTYRGGLLGKCSSSKIPMRILYQNQ